MAETRESEWIFEEFASRAEKRRAFASVTVNGVTKLLVWVKK